MRLRNGCLAATLLMIFVAPVAQADFYKWTDDTGRVHYSDQPKPGSESVDLESRRVQVPVSKEEADAEPSDAVKKARKKLREIQRWADRQPSKRREPSERPRRLQKFAPSLGGQDYSPIRDDTAARRERECQRVYGKSCAAIDRWKEDATADCARRNLSKDCKSQDYLSTQRPRTLEQEAEIKAKRAKRRERRDKRIQREIDALKYR